jgi:hypothetical protein
LASRFALDSPREVPMRQLLIALALLSLALITACTQFDSPTEPLDVSPSATQVSSDAQMARSAQVLGYIPGRVLVRFRAGAPIADLARSQGASVQRQLALGTRLLTVPAGREQAVAEALSRNPFVDFAEPDFFYTVDVPCGTGSCNVPTDGFFGFRWDLHNDGSVTDGQGSDVVLTGAVDADIDWVEAFNAMGPLSGSAVIGIIDTGILSTHEDLTGKVVAGYDFFDMDPDPADDHGHGTHVAGIAAAHGNNGAGVPGVAWVSEVRVASAKVCGYLYGFLHGCPSSAIADGIQWATDNGADVLNISLGGAAPTGATASPAIPTSGRRSSWRLRGEISRTRTATASSSRPTTRTTPATPGLPAPRWRRHRRLVWAGCFTPWA